MDPELKIQHLGPGTVPGTQRLRGPGGAEMDVPDEDAREHIARAAAPAPSAATGIAAGMQAGAPAPVAAPQLPLNAEQAGALESAYRSQAIRGAANSFLNAAPGLAASGPAGAVVAGLGTQAARNTLHQDPPAATPTGRVGLTPEQVAAANGPSAPAAPAYTGPTSTPVTPAGPASMVPFKQSQTVLAGDPASTRDAEFWQEGNQRAADAERRKGGINAQELAGQANILEQYNAADQGAIDRSLGNEQARIGDQRRALERAQRMEAEATRSIVSGDRRNTGERIMGGIAAALGAFAAGVNGGPNYALQTIEHAIDNDIQAQRANQGNARDSANGAQSMYRQMLAQGATEREAEGAERNFLAQRAAAEVRALAARSGSARARDEAEIIASGLEQRGAQHITHARDIGRDRTQTTTESRRVSSGGGGGRQLIVDRQGRPVMTIEAAHKAGLPVADAAKLWAMGYQTATNAAAGGVAANGGGGGSPDAGERWLREHRAEASRITGPLQELRQMLASGQLSTANMTVGRVAAEVGPLTSEVVTPDAVLRFRSVANDARNNMILNITGKAGSEAETHRLNQLFGQLFTSPESASRVIDQILTGHARYLAAIEGQPAQGDVGPGADLSSFEAGDE